MIVLYNAGLYDSSFQPRLIFILFGLLLFGQMSMMAYRIWRIIKCSHFVCAHFSKINDVDGSAFIKLPFVDKYWMNCWQLFWIRNKFCLKLFRWLLRLIEFIYFRRERCTCLNDFLFGWFVDFPCWVNIRLIFVTQLQCSLGQIDDQ